MVGRGARPGRLALIVAGALGGPFAVFGSLAYGQPPAATVGPATGAGGSEHAAATVAPAVLDGHAR